MTRCLRRQGYLVNRKRVRRLMQQIAAVVAIQCPSLVNAMLSGATVTITRLSSVEPDPDAVQFVKPILDALQPASKRHPYGIGVIVDDSAKHITLRTAWKRCAPKAGGVRIEVKP